MIGENFGDFCMLDEERTFVVKVDQVDEKLLEFLDKRLTGEAKAIIADLELSKQKIKDLLYFNAVLMINQLTSGTSAVTSRSVHKPNKWYNMRKYAHHPFWFTGVTAVFCSLIIGVFALMFAMYLGHQIAYTNLARSERPAQQ